MVKLSLTTLVSAYCRYTGIDSTKVVDIMEMQVGKFQNDGWILGINLANLEPAIIVFGENCEIKTLPTDSVVNIHHPRYPSGVRCIAYAYSPHRHINLMIEALMSIDSTLDDLGEDDTLVTIRSILVTALGAISPCKECQTTAKVAAAITDLHDLPGLSDELDRNPHFITSMVKSYVRIEGHEKNTTKYN